MSQVTTNIKKAVWKMIYVFITINTLAILLKKLLQEQGIDQTVVLAGNLLLFLVAVYTIIQSIKAIDHPNPHVFVRRFYAGFLIRLAVIAVAAFIYIYSQGGQVNKGALFICLGVYAVYSIIEVSALRRILKEKSNA